MQILTTSERDVFAGIVTLLFLFGKFGEKMAHVSSNDKST